MAPARIILIGFALLILAGALLLTLPISTRDGQGAAFFDALFTATSATCVTGLVVQDTALYWSGFGQAVILMLIQIGGMGVVTAAAAISMLAGRRIGLKAVGDAGVHLRTPGGGASFAGPASFWR